MEGKTDPRIARLQRARPWIALALLLTGILMTVPAFYLHNLWLALAGLVPLVGSLLFLLIPFPYSR